MKNRIYSKVRAKSVFVLFVVGLLTTSCSEEVLDKQPLDAISEGAVFSDPNYLQNYVNNNYNGIKPHWKPETGGFISLTDIGILNEDTHLVANPYNEYLTGGMTPDNVNSITGGLWGNQYSWLNRINLFFESTADSSIDVDVLDRFQGEMHFIRAHIYFELSRHFGGVPLITKPFSLNDESYDVARNSYDEVAQYVIGECDNAIAKLDGKAMPSGRASKGAAMALKARMLLYMASPLNNPSNDASKWQAAATATKAVIDMGYALHPNYAQVFKSPVKEEEVIFGRSFTGTNGVGAVSFGLSWGYNYEYWPSGFDAQYKVAPSQEFVNMFQMANGEYPYMDDGITINPTSGYDDQDPGAGRDPRFYDAILYPGCEPVNIVDGSKSTVRTFEYWEDANPDIEDENPDAVDPINGQELFDFGRDSKTYWLEGRTPFHWRLQTGYAFRKLMDFTGPRASTDFEYNQVTSYIRLAEMYLNYAEIQIALGNEAEAREYINKVRQRASVNMPNVTASGAELVKVYKRERAVELHLEDTRFYDLMRWKDAPGKVDMNPTRGIELVTKDYSNGGVLHFTYGTETDNRTAWPGDHYYLMPISRDEVQRSNNTLEQNPGYN
ncbi:RagB/SusD family nutrient uptake outer membrane protein [Snuella sedimenti]|uniref:RagB/SusD family nutrient uptake outer membrane protein n=1 Tax=Snuella sedimenti TaxID=2798802 RepID=A0A8J7J352_9FLAO|nr:RagB/SusD family nutrient uptake outer membrane protein [Snuella sedimenti]MBJ6367463.1 RagB/SusD family nutrient uptake outer membrane protein [Snuella sedimenti]